MNNNKNDKPVLDSNTAEKKDKTVKTISYIMIITFVGKIMALVREVLLGRAYGTGMEANAFLAASRVPRVFFDAIFASAITMSFIPIFSKYMKEGGKKKAFEFSNIFISYAILFTVILSVLGIFFSDNFAYLFAKKYDQATLTLCSSLLKILFPTMIFTGIVFVFIGILQSLEQFFIPAIISVIFNGVIIMYFFGPISKWGIYGLAFVYLIAWFMQMAVQVPSIVKSGYRHRFNFNLKNGYMKEVGGLILPVMVSTWVQPFNLVVGSRLASGFYSGSGVSALEFSNNLYTMIIAIFVLSIMNVMFPKMSNLINYGKTKELESLTSKTLKITLLIVLPMTVGLMSLSEDITRLIFGGGRFDEFSIKITSYALFYFAAGMIGYAFQNILSRLYFAGRKGKIPMIAAIVAIISNLILCYLLSPIMNIGGIALAASISGIINSIILMIPLLKDEHEVFSKLFFIDFSKILLAALIMGVVLYFVKPIIVSMLSLSIIHQIVKIAVLIVVGVLVYALSVFILRVDEIKNIKGFIRSRNSEV